MNPDPKPKNSEVLNIPCSIVDKAMAQQLAQHTDTTMSHVVRQAISYAHKMTFDNRPTCATGQNCLCPTMHAVRDSGGQTDAERVAEAHRRLSASHQHHG